MKIKLIPVLFSLSSFFFTERLFSQDTTQTSKPKIEISGYIDTYYSYDFSEPVTKVKLPFSYSYNRQNEFNINMALLRASVSYENVYAKLSVHAGTYVDENYASEDLKLLNEAYVGVYLNKSQKTALEAGILPSYIGFETATSHSNLTATRSISAEASPYFMTGVKLNHQFSDQLSGSILLTNGWQRINKVDKKLAPAFGTQLVYKANETSTLNWSTFAGKEAYGTVFGMRYFSDLYWDKAWSAKWRTILGFDFGAQDIAAEGQEYKTWWTPTLINQFTLSDKWQMAHRIEYFQDKDNVIVAAGVPFETLGNSLNFDFLPNSRMKIRTEGKWYRATESLFDLGTKKDNFSVTTTMSFEF
ncbi:outer membrane beta-barrel protein [Flavobacterium sp. GCM10023249]|uniref:outer membrane beta-barrel protein n=1 Tax=unclassified Flavobacterium TaxID=196869 RepID=UPI003607DA38